MKIGERKITGTTVEIHAQPHLGKWVIRLPPASKGETATTLGYDEMLENALGQARAKLAKAKVKVEVPFVTRDGRRGSAYGRHAGNRDVLVRIDGQAERISSERVLKPDTPERVTARLVEIEETARAGQRERRQLEREWALDLDAVVDAAITAKQAESIGAEA